MFDSKPLEQTIRSQFERRWETFRASQATTVLAATDTLARQPHYFLHAKGDAPKSGGGATWEKLTSFRLLVDALMATSAIPFLFPPRGHYVDGGVVRNQPLSAAVRLADEGEPIFVLLPHTDRLPLHPNLGNLVPTLLDIWLGAGLEREMKMVGITNTTRDGLRKRLTPVCVIQAGKDLEEVSGLLKFGVGVDALLQLGRDDAKAALARFKPDDPSTWPPEARP